MNALHDDQRATKDRGFTLVEILIAIVILGILATVTVFAVRGITDKGEEATCQSDRATMRNSANYYLANNGVAVIAPTGAGVDRFERTLVAENLLREVSTLHNVEADGTVVSADPTCP